jgi:hypothetical protein
MMTTWEELPGSPRAFRKWQSHTLRGLYPQAFPLGQTPAAPSSTVTPLFGTDFASAVGTAFSTGMDKAADKYK